MTAILYLASAVAFIVGLRRLGAPRTARSGNRIAALGMLAAIVITLVTEGILNWAVVLTGLAVGAIIGAWAAARVQMTAMPQMVAIFNGLGGIASALVASTEVLEPGSAGIATESVGPHSPVDPDRFGHLHRQLRGIRQAAGGDPGAAAHLSLASSLSTPSW